MRRSTYLAAAALLAAGCMIEAPVPAAAAPAAAQSATQESPSEVIQVAADGLLKALNTDREMYRKNPSKVQALVDQYILPHVDTRFAAQLVLGKYWRTATPQQRDRFINAFYHSMLNNYGAAIVEFTSNTLKVFPTRMKAGDQNATVRTEMARTSGPPVNVNYYMHETPQGWKAWDVIIDGVSYVKSYREDFGSQITQQGGNAAAIDSVINRLESGEKPAQIGKTTGSSS